MTQGAWTPVEKYSLLLPHGVHSSWFLRVLARWSPGAHSRCHYIAGTSLPVSLFPVPWHQFPQMNQPLLFMEIQAKTWASLLAQLVKNPPAVQETWVRSLGWEDPLEEGMASHFNILAWRIPIDRGAWCATIHGVTKSRTGPSN